MLQRKSETPDASSASANGWSCSSKTWPQARKP